MIKIEHFAMDVKVPLEMADWYVRHLGMNVVRKGPPPAHGHFLADATGRTLLEIYDNSSVTPPDYGRQSAAMLHLAFACDDLHAERQRLLSAGALAEGEPFRSDDGDWIAAMRDPWGIALQLVQRRQPMP